MYTPPIKGKAINKPRKVISPYSNPLQDIGHISSLVDELRALRQDIIDTADRELEKIDVKIEEVDSKLKEVDHTVEEIKDLEKGNDGKDADEQAVADYVLSQIKDWVHNQIVPQIRQPKNGKDGISPDPDEIVHRVVNLVPKVDEAKIVSRVLSKVPKQDLKILQQRFEVDPDVIIEKILKSPKLKLKLGNVDGLEATLKLLDRRYIHGGGDTVSAGTNVTITNVNGTKQINASASLTILTTSSTIDDSNVTFVFTGTPTLVNINGSFYNAGATVGGVVVWTNVGATVTLAFPVGAGGCIFAI